MPLRLTVLSLEGLENIAAHKYKPGKYTPLDNLLNPFWLRLAEALPRWLAPNLVTLLGFLPLVVTFALAWAVAPFFDSAPPRWLAFLTTAALYFYQTMDALDGKQARRLGCSTPLGQLFDHGCDCLTCLSQHSAGAMILLPGASLWTVFGMSALQSGFFMAQWQEYHTGVLRTSFGPVGVTETQLVLMLGALLAGIAGPEALQATFSASMDVPWMAASLTCGQVCIQGWILFCSVLIVICLFKTLAHVHAEKGVAGLLSSLKDLLPVLVLNSLLPAWNPSLLATAPREVCLLTALLFFYLTAQVILFSMARMPFPVLQPMLLPYAALVWISWTLPSWTYPVLVTVTTVTGLWVLLWLTSVIEELKAKLNIFAFSTAKPGAAKQSAAEPVKAAPEAPAAAVAGSEVKRRGRQSSPAPKAPAKAA